MNIRRMVAVCLLLLIPALLQAQSSISRVVPITATGTVSATDAGTCTVTNTGCVILPLGGYTKVSVQLTGTCGTCTAQFEVSVDGTTWVAQNMTPPNSATPAASTTAVGAWNNALVGPGRFRVRLSAIASGSFVVTIRATL